MKHPEFLENSKEETIFNCPICGSIQISCHDWPEPSLHGFTVPHLCGTEIDYPIGHDGATYGCTCDGEIKRFVMPEISEETRERFRKKNFFNKGDKLVNTKIENCEIDEY